MNARNRTQRTLWGALALTAALYLVPGASILAWPLLLLSTLAHEMGHGITAILVGGHFERFYLYANGSGVAVWGGDVGRIGRALVAAGGLVGPAVVAAALFTIAARPAGARLALGIAGIVLLVADVWLVRNVFGFIYVGVVGVVALTLGRRLSEGSARAVLTFLAGQLSLAVFSRADYLFTPTAHTGSGTMPSDVAHIAQALLLPYWVWGGLCAAFSVAVLAIGTRTFLARL